MRARGWDDWDVGEVLVTTVFAERDCRTTLTVTTLFPSLAELLASMV